MGDRWGASSKLGETPQVLCDRCQRELKLCTAGAAKAQSAEPKNALQVCEQHLDLFAITARLLECLSLCQRTGNVTRFLVDAARDPANRRLWTASRLERAAPAVEYAREVKQSRFPIVDQPACRRENLTRRTDVNVTLLVEREVFPIECPIVAPVSYTHLRAHETPEHL